MVSLLLFAAESAILSVRVYAWPWLDLGKWNHRWTQCSPAATKLSA